MRVVVPQRASREGRDTFRGVEVGNKVGQRNPISIFVESRKASTERRFQSDDSRRID